MTDSELIATLDSLRNTMIAVSTGGPRIEVVNAGFLRDVRAVKDELAARGIDSTLPYSDLWQWYGHWSSGDLPTYASRRLFVAELFEPIIDLLRNGPSVVAAPTGWTRVDRTMGEARKNLAGATTEEQFQAVGLLCREALISLAQAVYDPDRHPILDRENASPADAKRMIEAYIAVELGGASAEYLRGHARSALALASNLVHKRTATFRDAGIGVEATASVINIIAIVSGRRAP